MNIVNFTPWTALAGGLLIGTSAALMLLFQGRIAGISGIAKGVFQGAEIVGLERWRLFFMLGLACGGFLMIKTWPEATAASMELPFLSMILGGFCVGIGTAMGRGCTSGHGVCGLARRSPRSLTSVLVFMGVGFVTMYLMSHFIGGRI